VEGDLKPTTGQKTSPLSTSQGTWAKSYNEKTHAFTEHIAEVFQPHPSENKPEEEKAFIELLEAPYQLKQPTKDLKRLEVQKRIL
jgi:hypothetical protein